MKTQIWFGSFNIGYFLIALTLLINAATDILSIGSLIALLAVSFLVGILHLQLRQYKSQQKTLLATMLTTVLFSLFALPILAGSIWLSYRLLGGT